MPKFILGKLKFVWFVALNASKRNSTRLASEIRNDRCTEMSKLAYPGPSAIERPALPYWKFGGVVNAWMSNQRCGVLCESARFGLRSTSGRLEAWLRRHVEGFKGPIAAERFAGGQSNPTYKIEAASGFYVLRKKPPGPLLPSAHAVDREFRVMRALAGTPVPVPRVHALCEDDSVIGSPFYVMEFLDGRIFWDQRLPEVTPAERAAMFDSMNQVVAALHSVDYARLGLGDFGRPGNYMARQIARWSRQYRASEAETIKAMDNLILWLPQHLPPPRVSWLQLPHHRRLQLQRRRRLIYGFPLRCVR